MADPTKSAALRALADRVERNGPSRALDAEIACVLRVVPDRAPEWLREWTDRFIVPLEYKAIENRAGWIEVFAQVGNEPPQFQCARETPHFTTSVDAVMTLLPQPGHPHWTVLVRGLSFGSRGMGWTAEITAPGSDFGGRSSHHLAGALLAAVLRAHAAESDRG